jgi:hypothetical protein
VGGGKPVSRLVRLVSRETRYETVMALGGERGMVVLHLWEAQPECMVIHSPVPREGWTGPCRCMRMETECWCLNSVQGDELREELALCGTASGEEALWNVMAQSYHLYLEHA